MANTELTATNVTLDAQLGEATKALKGLTDADQHHKVMQKERQNKYNLTPMATVVVMITKLPKHTLVEHVLIRNWNIKMGQYKPIQWKEARLTKLESSTSNVKV